MVQELVVAGDFGGTNARLQALGSDGEFTHSLIFPRDEYDGPASILRQYEKINGGKIVTASLAIAGTMQPGTDHYLMVNGWNFSMGDLRHEFGNVRIMNDFTPVALSVIEAAENSETSNVIRIGGGKPVTNGNIVLVGPGTGLGSAYIPHIDGQYQVVESETSMTSVAQFDVSNPGNYKEKQILAKVYPNMRRHMILNLVAENTRESSFGHVCTEDLVSGPGLENIYNAVCTLNNDWLNAGNHTPPEISKMALAPVPDKSAREALDLMMHYMGVALGNMASSIKATGGAYIASHTINKIMDADPDYIASSPLRSAFEAKSKGFSNFMKDIPIFVLRDKEPAFNGLKYDLKRHLGI